MKFNNKFYNQIKGTAMSTIFAPTYATLLMRYFQIKLYSVCTFKYGELLAEYIKENCYHFLDDCYTVLTVFRWTLTINPQTPKGVCLLHPVTQIIVNEISHFV